MSDKSPIIVTKIQNSLNKNQFNTRKISLRSGFSVQKQEVSYQQQNDTEAQQKNFPANLNGLPIIGHQYTKRYNQFMQKNFYTVNYKLIPQIKDLAHLQRLNRDSENETYSESKIYQNNELNSFQQFQQSWVSQIQPSQNQQQQSSRQTQLMQMTTETSILMSPKEGTQIAPQFRNQDQNKKSHSSLSTIRPNQKGQGELADSQVKRELYQIKTTQIEIIGSNKLQAQYQQPIHHCAEISVFNQNGQRKGSQKKSRAQLIQTPNQGQQRPFQATRSGEKDQRLSQHIESVKPEEQRQNSVGEEEHNRFRNLSKLQQNASLREYMLSTTKTQLQRQYNQELRYNKQRVQAEQQQLDQIQQHLNDQQQQLERHQQAGTSSQKRQFNQRCNTSVLDIPQQQGSQQGQLQQQQQQQQQFKYHRLEKAENAVGKSQERKSQISQSLISQIINDKTNELPQVSANSWIVLDGFTGNQIFGRRVNQQVEVASLTKMMTLLVVLKWAKKYELDIEELRIKTSSVCASITGTTACLKHKDEVRIIDLLYGLMLPSGNDAAGVLAEGIGTLMYLDECGENTKKFKELKSINIRTKKITRPENYYTGLASQASQQILPFQSVSQQQDIYLSHDEKIRLFIKEMNRHSGEIGLSRTNFASVHGLINKSNISTAKDMAILGMTVMQDPLAKKIVGTKEYTATIIQGDKSSRSQLWENTNKLIDKSGYDGIKTGITDNAGACLATSFRKIIEKQDTHLIIVVLNCRNMEARFSDTRQICKWTLNKYIKKQSH